MVASSEWLATTKTGLVSQLLKGKSRYESKMHTPLAKHRYIVTDARLGIRARYHVRAAAVRFAQYNHLMLWSWGAIVWEPYSGYYPAR